MARTVHLSLNDELYSRLKRLAEERNISVTNLIRIILFNALRKIEEGEEDLIEVDTLTSTRRTRRANSDEAQRKISEESTVTSDAVLEKLLEIHDTIMRLKEDFEEKIVDLEFKIDMIKLELNRLKSKVAQLEDAYEDLVNPVHIEQVAPAPRKQAARTPR